MVVSKRTYFVFFLLATYTTAFEFGSILSGIKDAVGSIGGLFGGGGGGGKSSSPSAPSGGGGGGGGSVGAPSNRNDHQAHTSNQDTKVNTNSDNRAEANNHIVIPG